jgi:hypothetical protein
MKTESLPGSQNGSPSILFHLTKRRQISGTLDFKLTDMLRGNTQRPVQQPKYPSIIATDIISFQIVIKTFLMEESRSTQKKKIENTVLKKAL